MPGPLVRGRIRAVCKCKRVDAIFPIVIELKSSNAMNTDISAGYLRRVYHFETYNSEVDAIYITFSRRRVCRDRIIREEKNVVRVFFFLLYLGTYSTRDSILA